MTEPVAPGGGPSHGEPPDGEPTDRAPRIRSRFGVATFTVGLLITAGTIVAIAVDDDTESADAPTTSSTSTSTTTSPPATSRPSTTVVGRELEGPPPPSCGSGTAEATPMPSTQPNGNRYPTRAEIVSQFDRPIEVLRLALRITFQNGTAQDVDLHTQGVVVPPDERGLVSGPTIESESPPVRWETILVSYQTEGRPDCAVSM